MSRTFVTLAAGAAICLIARPTCAQWLEYVDETNLRSNVSASLFASDSDEKDYAWDDLDNDGDIDLVIVRKQPFTSTGKRVNVLLMNENGVLVDRTTEYASASDVAGDQGFNTATNDRDVAIADVDNDGWKDLITATTLTDNQAKHLSHPRIYMNLGNDGGGNWLGFRHEDDRIPQMHSTAGPRFCSVAAADLTGDGFVDLYFGDYDSGGSQIFDYNNKLLINNGNGFFSDQSNSRLDSEMRLSAFGAATEIHDMNGDGVLDVIKQTSLNPPQHVAITYNDAGNEGFFSDYDIIDQNAPYFVDVNDLNNDGMMDMIVVDDFTDRYYLNTGNGGDGLANFSTFSLNAGAGFGGNALIVDLNDDGWRDIIVTDVDVDIPGCNRTTEILRNLGNAPNVTFQDQTISGIPVTDRRGVHDVAVFDINGDNYLDIVMGRCNTTEIYMNVPPIGIVFSYPNGQPGFLTPGEALDLVVELEVVGDATIDPGSVSFFYAVNGSGFAAGSVTPLGGDQYQVSLPAVECTDIVNYYFAAELDGGASFSDPGGAPGNSFGVIAADGTEVILQDTMEGDVSDWTVQNSNVSTGAWEQADPNGTIFNNAEAAPDEDATAGSQNVMAFVTENGLPGGDAGTADLDGGPTDLISPTFNLDGTDASVSYRVWFFSDGGGTHVPDFLTVDISNDNGSSWTNVPSQTTGGTNSSWELASFVVSEHITPTASMRVRFRATDNPNNSITEAGIDNFQIDAFVCGDEPDPCPTDVNGDGETSVVDLVEVITNWGTDNPAADINDDGTVDVLDLVDLILAWGPCP